MTETELLALVDRRYAATSMGAPRYVVAHHVRPPLSSTTLTREADAMATDLYGIPITPEASEPSYYWKDSA